MSVLIISTITPTLPIYELEFIRPIMDIVSQEGKKYAVVHISKITSQTLETAEKIIISGTAYQDNEFLTYKKNIKQIIEHKKNIPTLGICAGAELLLPEDITLENISEIGPLRLEQLNEDKLTCFLDDKEAYFLHQLGIHTIPFGNNDIIALLATTKGIAAYRYKHKPIWGLQFHPEVSNKEIIRTFLSM